jgi:glycosyltransferase involved in cell wall biosynthesis
MSAPLVICAHVTTVHRGRDVRIFRKEARTLASSGFEVVLIHPEGEIASEDGVRFSGLALDGGRLRRFALGGFLAYRRARALKARVFHFHDPELIPWALLWRLMGGISLYDVHEDVPKAVHRKAWIPSPVRGPISWSMRILERFAARGCNAVVAATEPIAARFPSSRTVVVRNYPENLEDFSRAARPWSSRRNAVMYAGTLTRDRGLHRMLDAIQRVDPALNAQLVLAGPLRGERLVDSAGRELPPHLLRFEGHVSRERVVELSGEVRVGLHVVEPLQAYQESLPIKIFEYMAAGVPCVVSDFPAWRSMIERHRCGVTVNPLSVDEIAEAISALLREGTRAEQLGRNGALSAAANYDWKTEGDVLVTLYRRLVPTA